MPAPPALKTRTALVKDAHIWRHFQHLPELPERQQGVPWQVEYVTVPMTDLHCPYPTPGEQEAPPGGLMGAIGWPPGSALGRRIVDLAAAIAEQVRLGAADVTNPALKKVLGFQNRGRLFIRSRAQPLVLTIREDVWCVREGVYRSIALALTGARELEGFNVLSLRQATA